VALWLRLVHLGTPSLWWDEVVQIRTAERPLARTIGTVRFGVTPGAGSAGAMPADYLLLHAYLAATPRPSPERLEGYFRTPACLASVLAVPALWVVGRSAFGWATGAGAAWLLALSLPGILYAAEVRSYSLLALATVIDMAAFAALVRAPDRAARWLVHLAANLFLVFTGIFGLFVIGVQYAILAVLAVRGRATRRGLVAVAASAALFAILLGRYLAGTNVTAPYPRNAVVEPLAVTWASLRFLAADSPALLGAFLVAIPFAIRAGVRRGTAPVAWATVLAFGALPAIALVIRWKHYYFHERHALFLLPLFHLTIAAGSVALLRGVDPLRRFVHAPARRRALETAALAVLALGLALPSLRSFLAVPQAHFARTKTLRDLGPVARDVAAELATVAPGTPYLLLAERDTTANAVLSTYLRWYGIADRVTLRSPGVPLDRVEPILQAGGGDPAGLRLRPAHGLFFGFRSLLGLERQFGDVPPRVSHYAIIGYATPQRGPDVRRYWNVSLRVPGATAPWLPRS
jgi:hypothetical protein